MAHDAASRRNRRLGIALFGVAIGMVGLSFAAVPLYTLFCQVTGFGGTTQVAQGPAGPVLDRTVRVRFTGTADGGLPWEFRPETREMELKVGEPGLVYYSATNRAAEPVAGQAVYNVTPDKAGLYFAKVECFCFTEQIIQPGQTAQFPVYFYVDPAMGDDPNLDDVVTITLSYTFYRHESKALDDAVERYYQSAERVSAPAGPAGRDAAMTADTALEEGSTL